METYLAADRYHHGSIARYFLFLTVSIPLLLVAPTLTSSVVEDGTWSVVTAIATFWFGAALALALFEKLRAVRNKAEYALRFPGFQGNCFPIFYLLTYEDGAGAVEFNNPELVYSLGEADQSLFFLQNKRSDDLERLPLGKLLTAAPREFPLALRLDEITDVVVVERSDAEIAGSAVDPRDFAERLGSQIAQRLTGTSMKKTIVPYAAYVAITAVTETEKQFVLLAIPTTVTIATLMAMGERITDRNFETPWLVDAAVNKASSMIKTEIEENIPEFVGKWTDDAVGGRVQSFSDAANVVGEAMQWIDPDAAAVSTPAGARGRRMAQLIATRIRQRVGRLG